MSLDDPEYIAECTYNWWRAHHERDYNSVIENMVKEHIALFGIDEVNAKRCVELKILAAKAHDKAEEEEIGEISERYWLEVKKYLTEYYKSLKMALMNKS